MPTILVCDDDKQIVEAINIYLTGEGFNVIKAYDGYEALELLEKNEVNLMIVDVMMPGLDGIRTTLKVRETSSIPIIILSAKSEDTDKILGLNIGADDYITKPFSIKELLARVKANIRRRLADQQDSMGGEKREGGPFQVDTEKRLARKNGETLELSQREFDMLCYFLECAGRVVTREELMEKVWGFEYYGDLRTVDVAIRRLREKLEDDPADPRYLITRRGAGYYFNKE